MEWFLKYFISLFDHLDKTTTPISRPLTCYRPLHTQSVMGSCPDFLRILSLIAFWIQCSRFRGGDRRFCKGGLRTWSEELHQNPGGHLCDNRNEEAEYQALPPASSKSRGRREDKAFSDHCPLFMSPTAVICKQDNTQKNMNFQHLLPWGSCDAEKGSCHPVVYNSSIKWRQSTNNCNGFSYKLNVESLLSDFILHSVFMIINWKPLASYGLIFFIPPFFSLVSFIFSPVIVTPVETLFGHESGQ